MSGFSNGNRTRDYLLSCFADNTPSLESVQRLRQRKRNLFSPRQVRELVKCFRRKQYLSAFERESLARKIELSPKQVMIWFQNYRYKHRRLQKLGISKDKLDKDIFDETVSSTELDHHGRNFFAGSDMSIDRNSVGVVHSQNVRVPLQSEVTLSLSDFSLLLASSLMYPSVLGFGSAQVPRQWEGLPNTQ